MFRRLGNLIKGLFLRLIGRAEKSNPEALLEVEKENLREQIAEFNRGLATHAAMVERLISQVRKLGREEEELRSKTAANLKAGNRESAGHLALRLKTVDRDHDEVARQLEDAEKRYKELVRARDVSVKEAKEKIESLRRNIDDMKVQRAMAELNEMSAGMVTEIGGAGETLNRLEEVVEEERTKAAGRARVARDAMSLSDIEMKDAEQDVLAEMALADFAAAEGIELEPAPDEAAKKQKDASPGETTRGTMGPAASE